MINKYDRSNKFEVTNCKILIQVFSKTLWLFNQTKVWETLSNTLTWVYWWKCVGFVQGEKQR